MNSRRSNRFGLLIWICALLIVQAVGASSLTGTVLQDNGTPLGGAVVSAQLQRNSPTTAPFRADAITQSNGTFTVAGLSAGNYQVCVQPRKSPFLSNCDWNLTPITTTVGTANVSLAPITLQKGTPLHVHIFDTQQFLSAGKGTSPNSKTNSSGDLLVGLWLPSGLFMPMPLSSQDKYGRDFEAPIPYAMQVYLSVHGGSFQVSDSSGAAVDPPYAD
jgi:hypothetical protein